MKTPRRRRAEPRDIDRRLDEMKRQVLQDAFLRGIIR